MKKDVMVENDDVIYFIIVFNLMMLKEVIEKEFNEMKIIMIMFMITIIVMIEFKLMYLMVIGLNEKMIIMINMITIEVIYKKILVFIVEEN